MSENQMKWVKAEDMKRNLIYLAVLLTIGIAMVASAQRPVARRYIKQVPRYAALGVQLPFSDGVLVGDTFYVAGHLGLDPKTGKPLADAQQGARLLLDAIKATLAQGGLTTDDLVSVTLYCTDLSLYDKFNAVYRTYFSKDFPARAFIGTGSLLLGAHFEMQGIAVKR